MKNEPQIIIENLNKSFGKHQVLSDVNLTINKGESFVVIGGSGTGKSVLIKTIIGLFQANSGRVIIDGEDITKLNEKSRHQLMNKIGFLAVNKPLLCFAFSITSRMSFTPECIALSW